MVARKLMDTSIYPSTIFQRAKTQSVVKYKLSRLQGNFNDLFEFVDKTEPED